MHCDFAHFFRSFLKVVALPLDQHGHNAGNHEEQDVLAAFFRHEWKENFQRVAARFDKVDGALHQEAAEAAVLKGAEQVLFCQPIAEKVCSHGTVKLLAAFQKAFCEVQQCVVDEGVERTFFAGKISVKCLARNLK